VLRKFSPLLDTNIWPLFDGKENVLAGNLDIIAEGQPATMESGQR